MDIQIFQTFVIPSKLGIQFFTNFDLPPIRTTLNDMTPEKLVTPVASNNDSPTKKRKVAKIEDEQKPRVLVKREQLDRPEDTQSKPDSELSTKKRKIVKSEVKEDPEGMVKQEQLGDIQDAKSNTAGSNSRGDGGKESNAKPEEGRKPYTGDFATRAEYAAHINSLAAGCGLWGLLGFR